MLTTSPRGPFSLAASSRFLEAFAPAGPVADDGPLRLVFAPDRRGATTGAVVTQTADGVVRADVVGAEPGGSSTTWPASCSSTWMPPASPPSPTGTPSSGS